MLKFLLLSQLLISSTFAQTKELVLENFLNNYSLGDLNNKIITYSQKFKSSISEDTFICKIYIYQKKTENRMKYRMDYYDGGVTLQKSIFYDDQFKNYTEYYKKEKIINDGKKFKKTSYFQLLSKIPVENPNLLKNFLESNFFNGKNYYQFSSPKGIYLISKNFNSYKTIDIKSTNLGIEYNQETISISQNEDSNSNYFNIDSLFIGYKKFDRNTIISISKKDLGKPILGEVFNEVKLEGGGKKYYLIDMFYESCLPCVKSIPILRELQIDSSFSLCQIIGVDPILRDTLNINKFIKRFNINYKVISGNLAYNILLKININTYPTTFLLNESGELIYYHSGMIDSKDVLEIKKLVNQNE